MRMISRRVPLTPSAVKRFFLLAAAAYIVSPIDLIPDFVPLAGWADDFVVLLMALSHARKLVRGEPVLNPAMIYTTASQTRPTR
jgi:uncharacterized membrane protein YkvA (DUF1232 family)